MSKFEELDYRRRKIEDAVTHAEECYLRRKIDELKIKKNPSEFLKAFSQVWWNLGNDSVVGDDYGDELKKAIKPLEELTQKIIKDYKAELKKIDNLEL